MTTLTEEDLAHVVASLPNDIRNLMLGSLLY